MSVTFFSRKDGGGYADRLLGLVSCKTIAQILQLPFHVVWSEDLSEVFTDYVSSKDLKPADITYCWIDGDGVSGYAYTVMTELTLETWKSKHIVIQTNQPDVLYMADNPNFKFDRTHIPDMMRANFREIYSTLCIPTQKVQELVAAAKPDKPYVAIHVRCGDNYIMPDRGVRNLTVKDIDTLLSEVMKVVGERTVFIASDSKLVYERATHLGITFGHLERPNEVHFNDSPAHDASHTIADHILISQATQAFVWLGSGFGLYAAMIGGHATTMVFDNPSQKPVERILNKGGILLRFGPITLEVAASRHKKRIKLE